MDPKRETIAAYDCKPRYFEAKFKRTAEAEDACTQRFCDLLPPNATVVDLGCGPGFQAERIAHHGHRVLCTDISEEMLNICKLRGLDTMKMDLEHITLPCHRYDGVVCHTSLLHCQKKDHPRILTDIRRLLTPQGMLLFSMKEGTGEGMVTENDDAAYGLRRWFALYQKPELDELLKPQFSIDSYQRIQPNPQRPTIIMTYVLRVKQVPPKEEISTNV